MRELVAHLSPGLWSAANRLLVRKAIAEFAHERLLTPEPLTDGWYGLAGYRFRARLLSLDHWEIDLESLTCPAGTPDILDFVLEFRDELGLTDEVLPVYLEELSSTLSSLAYKLAKPYISARDLAQADFQTIETAMTEGHPGFVANSGRLGYGLHDHHAFAPEAAQPVRLVWLAGHRSCTTFTHGAGLDYAQLIRSEGLEPYVATLTELGLTPGDYLLIPVHPWQWWNKLSITFAGEIARGRLVFLGESDDVYLAQQSVRTFFNIASPARHYVKTAISVLNMGFTRGLSAAYMEATPAINDWLAELIESDRVLKGTGLTILRERAAVGYRHRQFEAATDRTSPYRKMLAALWRESPVPSLAPGQRLATMASLLHVDRDGRSLAAELITLSGLRPCAWVRRYLEAYLVPLLHAFYAHELAFMPHGENVILVLDGHAVERVIFKDIAEEIVVMGPAVELPPAVERIRARIPEETQLLCVFTDVFDGFLRYLSALLDGAGVLAEGEFWGVVAACVAGYQRAVPELGERFARHDVFVEEFALSCLNRLQLRNNRQMVDLSDPAAALQVAGTLRNPIAGR
ncbi:IucA/IucC family protein [Nonomuraea soli]|uniref:Siderophore synthetase component n=1 Tax=Nonomuraea soli TaxID=1032476 RepID=A0A7W0HV42_9ACTN|nr:IucA/IucC family siderophore biosynthesis protein [Nonomuraea soli]MBA2896770.1 siderophore synthetase component [Nonomuraea soli]